MTLEMEALIQRAATEDRRMNEAQLRADRRDRTCRFLSRSFGVSYEWAVEIYDRVHRPTAPVAHTHCTVTGDRV
jgi:hypothetical protein